MSTALVDPISIQTILQVAGGTVLPRCLHAVANLGIADALGDTPQTAESLAAATGTNAGALGRALRLLSAHGVFTYHDGRFAHSPASRLLRADHPQSMRALARMFGLPIFWTLIGDLEYSIRTGLPAAEHLFEGGGPWKELSRDLEASRIFDDAMTAKAHGQVAGVLAAYDFSGVRMIGDIGGGRGHLLRAILDRLPSATGVVFDQPHVVNGVEVSDRLGVQAGNFFADTLPACDLYLLMEVIHDWDDERARQILAGVRAAATPGARLLLIEALMPDESGPNWPLTLDLWMLSISGKQRTLEEYAALLTAAGFTYERMIGTQAGVAIIEAKAA